MTFTSGFSGGRHIRKSSKTYPKSNFGWYGPPTINKAIASSATNLEFVKSIVPEPINKAIVKPAAIIKKFLVPPADSDEKLDINENSIYTVNELVGPEPIAD